MVFSASDARVLTGNTITTNTANEIQQEITNCESDIRLATSLELFEIFYNATIIGNPNGNPQISSNLTSNQLTFYNLLTTAGYVVGLDAGSGKWRINWSPMGPEALVSIYSFRTIVDPGAIHDLTVAALETFFTNLVPTTHSVAVSNGSIDLTMFGATASTFYEYTMVVDQEFDDTDYSSELTTYLTTRGLGYTSGNCNAYRMI